MGEIFNSQVVLPVLIVAAYGLVVLVMSPFLRERPSALAWFSALGLVMAGWASARQWGMRASTAYGLVRVDEYSVFFNIVFLVVGLLAVLVSIRYLQRQGSHYGEYYALMLLSVAGMMTMAASDNLLVIFVGLELLSIPLYVLAGLTRTRARSVESSLKYFLLGAFSTGFIVYGLAFIYGATGTLDLRRVADLAPGRAGAPPDATLLLGVGLLLVGFSFKIAAVPFHFWAPDVYQGAPTTVAGFMAAGTKAAAFAALVRILGTGLAGSAETWTGLVVVLSILTMTVANLAALVQTNIKRLLAYSSIAHAGYLLIPVATLGTAFAGARGAGRSTVAGDAVQALGFYLLSYAFMTVGAFAVAALVGRDGPEGEEGYSLGAYAGLARRRPFLAAAMAVFLLSLAGLPPTAGFIAKFYVFKAALRGGAVFLAVVGLLNSVVAAGYYLRVIVAMYMKEPAAEPAEQPAAPGLASGAALAIAVAGTLYLGVLPGRLLDAARSLYGSILAVAGTIPGILQ